jgi:hypothetical protein
MTYEYLIKPLRDTLRLTESVNIDNNFHYNFIAEVPGEERVKLFLLLQIFEQYHLLEASRILIQLYVDQPDPCKNQAHISLRRIGAGLGRDFARIAFVHRAGQRFFFPSFYESIRNLTNPTPPISTSAANNTDVRFSPVNFDDFIKYPQKYLRGPNEIIDIAN